MKTKILFIIAGLIFTVTLFQTAKAQTAKEASLIAHLFKEANEPDGHTAEDVYLTVTIGKTEYISELKSGKLVKQRKAEYSSGGFYGAYAEVRVNFMGKNQQTEDRQGGSQLLKLTGKNWKRIALNETDYQCADVKSVPKAVLKALDVECF